MAVSNTFQSMQPDFKETYSKEKRFKRTKKRVSKKATAELDASKDPMSALRDKSYLDIRGKKGVAV
jgi:hypothetical protein